MKINCSLCGNECVDEGSLDPANERSRQRFGPDYAKGESVAPLCNECVDWMFSPGSKVPNLHLGQMPPWTKPGRTKLDVLAELQAREGAAN